jgi:hypothetical protein
VNLDDFYRDIRNTVSTRAAVDNDFKSTAFMTEVGERLAEAEEIEALTVIQFEGVGVRNRRLAINGFDLDDEDGSIALAVLLFNDSDEISTIAMAEAKRALAALENFLAEALVGTFEGGREESSQAYQLASDLRRRGKIVTRYRLYLITDARMSDRVRAIASSEVNGIRVDFDVWDIQRLYQVHESRQGREELEIDLTEWVPGGLRALKVSGASDDFATYLAAVPGEVIADLYGRFGSRLLEGNVRSFLSARGKVNKGIRITVLSEPEMFLAYNNGITATATGVESIENGTRITKIRDLQIVNGGQTTASLFYIHRDDANYAKFKDVVVQMKLVVVTPERSVELVPNISRYANSQNRVSDADFFSNSAFHVRLEELSRRILAPAQPGVNFQTKWFYERTRGQYLNERSKLSTSDARKFQITYPRTQLISKTDAAKYEVSWAMKPHLVSAGAQKNFAAFAAEASSKWEASDAQFNEVYFRDLVAKAILFNEIRGHVAHSDWYQSGYLANIVTYTLAKLAFEVQKQGNGNRFDFARIWSAQSLPPDVLSTSMEIAVLAFGALTDPRRRIANVTEWAKNEECWRAIQAIPYVLSADFVSSLTTADTRAEVMKGAVAVQRIDSGIEAQSRVVAMGADKWLSVQQFSQDHRLLTPTDAGILDVATGKRRGIPTERQSTRLLEILNRANQNGFQVN